MLEWSAPQDIPRNGYEDEPLYDAVCSSLQADDGANLDLKHVALSVDALLKASDAFPAAVKSNSAKSVSKVLDDLTKSVADAAKTAADDFVVLGFPGTDRGTDQTLPNLLGLLLPRPAIHDADVVDSSQAQMARWLVENGFAADTAVPSVQERGLERRAAMGIVDLSIAFLNRRFMREAGTKTRFEMLWIQGRTIHPASDEDIPPTHALMGTGTFLMREDIDALIERHLDANGVLDEEAAYAEFSTPPEEYRNPWTLRSGHGTAVLDHMAGAEPGTLDDTRPLYGVELPTAILAEPSGTKLLPLVLHGLSAIALFSFLFPVAQRKETTDPLIMNASLSFTGGPDTEDNFLSGVLAKLLTSFQSHNRQGGNREIRLTIPCGNHLQDRVHAELPKDKAAKIDWIVPPDDRTTSVVEIFQDKGQALDLLELTVSPPGEETRSISAKELPGHGQYIDLRWRGDIIARIARARRAQGPDHLVLKIRPTYVADASQPVSPSGVWTIAARAREAAVHLWIRRDDTLDGFALSGRQSRFHDGAYRRFDDFGDLLPDDPPENGSMITRAGTMSAVGHAAGAVVRSADAEGASADAETKIHLVAGTQHAQGQGPRPYRFGGKSSYKEANFSDMAEESRVKGGPMAAGRRSHSVVRLSGTSIASARCARQIAEDLRPTGVTGSRGHSEY